MHARAYRPSQYNGLGGGSGVAESWPSVRVEHVESSGAGVAAEVGALLSVRAFLSLGELTPDDVHESLIHSRWMDIFGRSSEFLHRFVWEKQSPPGVTTTQPSPSPRR